MHWLAMGIAAKRIVLRTAKRLLRSVSLNLDDHLDFNGIVEGKSRHPYGRACVR
jgi:hypothetical protein